jgi:hypothetical protein
MTEKPPTPETTPPSLSDWDRLAHRNGPNFIHWMLISAIAAGLMLYLSPVLSTARVLISIIGVLLSPAIFLLGWMTGMSMFATSCEHYRRSHRTWPLVYLLPVLLAVIVGLGLLGGRYWWLFSLALAILGHRKGTQRAWWAAVACLAFIFRDPGMGLPPVAHNDEDALAQAIDVVNKEIGRGSSKRDT